MNNDIQVVSRGIKDNFDACLPRALGEGVHFDMGKLVYVVSQVADPFESHFFANA